MDLHTRISNGSSQALPTDLNKYFSNGSTLRLPADLLRTLPTDLHKGFQQIFTRLSDGSSQAWRGGERGGGRDTATTLRSVDVLEVKIC